MYTATSKRAQEVAKELGFRPEIHYVAIMERNGTTYVRATATKPDELRALKRACESRGYRFSDPRIQRA